MASLRKPPATQIICEWVIDNTTEVFERLEVVCIRALTKNLKGWSADEIADLSESEVSRFLPEALRNEYAKRKDDGGTCTFEIDNEEPPYIKRAESKLFELSAKIKKMDWRLFEVLCGEILKKIGGKSLVTGQPNDGGVDFYATEVRNYSLNLPIPKNASLCIIGQAKRYTSSINESELRKFIGGAILKLEELKKTHTLGLLSPTLFAFWTSSDLHINAKQYAKEMGIWYMDGFTFAQYIQELQLSHFLDEPKT